MSSPIAVAVPPPQGIFSNPATSPQAAGSFNVQDLERLRNLVAEVPSAPNVTEALPPQQVQEVQKAEIQTLGDSILDGITSFNSGYHDSLKNISAKIDRISNADPLQLGSNFGEIMTLQVEVARWSMSVTGVDNASKAGTNTIKELSKGA